MGALVYWVIAAVVTAFSAFQQSEARRRDNEYQAKVARNNALAAKQEGEIDLRINENDLRVKDVQREKLKREYRAAAGTNTSLLAAGNVDISSGSALDLLEGNANRYANDMGELAFEKAQTDWTGKRKAQTDFWKADVYNSQASYLERTAGSFGGSLLSGATAGLTSYFNSAGKGA